MFDTLFNGKGSSEAKQVSSQSLDNTEKSSGASFSDNFASLFGGSFVIEMLLQYECVFDFLLQHSFHWVAKFTSNVTLG